MSENSSENSEKRTEVAAFIKAVENGLIEVQEGKTLSLDEVKRRLSFDELSARSAQMLNTAAPIRLVGVNRSVQFLRGVFSRASMCVPAFYYFLGAMSAYEDAVEAEDHQFKIVQSYFEFSNLNTLTLACRKMFDHSLRPDLTGGNFGKLNERDIEEHAIYWSTDSNFDLDDCRKALLFLQKFFAEYSQTHSALLKKDGWLHKRIGLLKQHADRAAAHLSLENYSLDIRDLAHFTASLVIVGEIVRSFDTPAIANTYFNDLDEGAYLAAKKIFPQLPEFRLFGHLRVDKQARAYWRYQEYETIQSCFDKLQLNIG